MSLKQEPPAALKTPTRRLFAVWRAPGHVQPMVAGQLSDAVWRDVLHHLKKTKTPYRARMAS